MKTFKFLVLLTVLGLFGLFTYQNWEYFIIKSNLGLDLKVPNGDLGPYIPELPNLAYWGICFGLGLLITGFKGMMTSFSLGREIKRKDKEIAGLKEEMAGLESRLDVFIHDPYIQKRLEEGSLNLEEGSLTDEPSPEKESEDGEDQETPEPVGDEPSEDTEKAAKGDEQAAEDAEKDDEGDKQAKEDAGQTDEDPETDPIAADADDAAGTDEVTTPEETAEQKPESEKKDTEKE